MTRWIDEEGSSRPMGLLRLILALIAWCDYGEPMAFFHWTDAHQAALSVAFWFGSTALLVGFASRLAAAWTGAVQMWLVLGIGGPVYDHHHTWLLAIGTFLLAFTPCGASFSVDRWLDLGVGARRGAPPPERGPQWGVRLICLQVTALYLLAAVDKLSWGFLSGQRLQMIFAATFLGSDPPQIAHWSELTAVMAVLVVATELFLSLGLWFRRTRGVAIAVGIALHAAFYLLIPVATFSVTTVALYLAFVDPDRFHAGIDRLLGGR